MKIPGPDHPITLAPAAKRWRARFAGHVIADSANALVLQEASYPPVIYFPREDVEIGYLSRTARGTHCPYKGDASYFTLHMDGQFAENSVWTYETPFPAMEQIAGRLAFYTDKIEVYAIDEAVPQDRSAVDDAVLHTDTGAGYSQREHWPVNVQAASGAGTPDES